MATETAARTEVLRRIRAALGPADSTPALSIQAEWESIPRLYRRHTNLSHDTILELLEDRLRDYDAHVERVEAAQLSDAIERLVLARNLHRIVIPQGLPELLHSGFGQQLPQGIDFVLDDNLSSADLDGIPGVLTAAQVAIATTGTLVLQTVPGQGRRAATLIPDYHLCIVRQNDAVETVPEAFDQLQPTASLATTFISGPSATADIEMTRIKGVHGPRFLDVLLVY